MPWTSCEAAASGLAGSSTTTLADLLLERACGLASPAATKLALDVSDPLVAEREARHFPEHDLGPVISVEELVRSSAHAAMWSNVAPRPHARARSRVVAAIGRWPAGEAMRRSRSSAEIPFSWHEEYGW
jgi:hypothetical protein